MKEALKLALEALESGVKTTANRISWTEYDCELMEQAITAIKEALAQPEQEVDWKDQYEKQKRRAEMWLAKYEEVAGPAPCAVPLAQPDYRAVKTYHEGKPVYVSQPEQELEYCVDYHCAGDCGQPHNQQERQAFLVAQPLQRPWVGLTDEQREECTQSPFTEDNYDEIEAKLKELNT